MKHTFILHTVSIALCVYVSHFTCIPTCLTSHAFLTIVCRGWLLVSSYMCPLRTRTSLGNVEVIRLVLLAHPRCYSGCRFLGAKWVQIELSDPSFFPRGQKSCCSVARAARDWPRKILKFPQKINIGPARCASQWRGSP